MLLKLFDRGSSLLSLAVLGDPRAAEELGDHFFVTRSTAGGPARWATWPSEPCTVRGDLFLSVLFWRKEHWCLMVACSFHLLSDDDGRNVLFGDVLEIARRRRKRGKAIQTCS